MDPQKLTQKIKKACQEKDINVQQLAKSPKVNMSTSGLYAALSNNSLKVPTLIAIADELEVSVMDFIMEGKMPIEKEMISLRSDIDKAENKIAFLNEQIEDKNKVIELSEKMLGKNEYVINYLNDKSNRIKNKYKELQENFRAIDDIYDENIEDGKKKNAEEKRLKLIKKELNELRGKITEIISEEY